MAALKIGFLNFCTLITRAPEKNNQKLERHKTRLVTCTIDDDKPANPTCISTFRSLYNDLDAMAMMIILLDQTEKKKIFFIEIFP